MFVDSAYTMNPNTKMMEQLKTWNWVDGIELPEDLEELVNYLVNNTKSIYRHSRAITGCVRRWTPSLTLFLGWNVPYTYMEEFFEVTTLRGKARKMALTAQGLIVKSTPYFDKEVYEALYGLT